MDENKKRYATLPTAVDRRRFLQVSGIAAAAAMAGGGSLLSSRAIGATPARAVRAADLRITMKAKKSKVAILPGARTRVWNYVAKVRGGDKASVAKIPGSYLGPVIRVRKGDRFACEFTHRLSEESIVHWHGLDVPQDMDGHPRFAIDKGERYSYEFDVINRAGMYWFHPHPHGRTGPQVYNGLAGLFIVSDDDEDALGLPSGDYDVPLVLQDRRFDANNQFIYDRGFGPMMGMLGDEILVNGAHEATLDVEARPYRLRLLNGSNSRIYKLAWEDGTPITVIATDGGLLRKPVTRDYITLAPAERVEIWVDFADHGVGAMPKLVSLRFEGGGGGMGGGMMGRDGDDHGDMGQGDAFEVMTLNVVNATSAGNPLPNKLSSFAKLKLADAVNKNDPRRFEYGFSAGRWLINGRSFQMTAVAPDEIVQGGTLEVWELENVAGGMGPGGGMGPMMPHPVHLHGEQFQILKREVGSIGMSDWRSVKNGFVDDGWKDTVLVMPGEKVTILRRFDNYTGLFLQHCHNLEHEDAGMMRNFEIT